MDPFEYAHKHNVVWMAQNTNLLPTTPKIKEAVMKSLNEEEYSNYPYKKGIFGLKEAVLNDLGLPDFEVILTGGGTEALYIIMRAMLKDNDEVITSDPSYFIIHHFIEVSKGIPTNLPIYKNPWKYTVEQINEAVNRKTKMILLIDPINPLGTGYSRDEVKAICEIANDNNLFVLNDITYRDFADSHTLTAEFAPAKTIIAYSVSKNCGMAGMRTGALVAPPELMHGLRVFNTNDLSINILGQRAALAALETKNEWIQNVKKITRNNQKIIKKCVDKIDGVFLPVYPSQANMFLIDISERKIKPEELQNKLLYEHNIFVRAGNYVSKSFGDRFIRTSFSIPEEGIKKFVDVFPGVVEGLSK